jgi:hypothetical protein
MMRALVALLLLANLAFFAWSQGWLDSVVGMRAGGDREPERLARQVRPEMIRIVTPQAAAAAASAAAARLACLEAGPFDPRNIGAAESALASTLPSGTWARTTTEQPARWILYLGRYVNREAMQRRAQELNRLGIAFDEVVNAPELEPGLSLGRFSSRDAAELALDQLARRGIRNARAIELAKPSIVHTLRVERAEPELAAKVIGLKLDALGRGFVRCTR